MRAGADGNDDAIAAIASAASARGFGAVVQMMLPASGASTARMPATSLSRIAPKTSAHIGPAAIAEIGRERASAGRVVRGIEEQLGAAPPD